MRFVESMGLEYRIDAASSLKSPVRTEQGFLRLDGLVSRPGIYQYEDPKMPGGWRRELLPRDVAFDAAALAGFEGAPVTINHVAKVTPGNVKRFEVGTVLSARQDGDAVAATMVIKDADAIKAIEAGKRKLSPGRAIQYDPTPGNDPEFGRYDGIQRLTKVNHLAIVDIARGGEQMQLRMDGIDVPIAAEKEPDVKNPDDKTEAGAAGGDQQRDDGGDASAQTIKTLNERIATLETQLADANRTLESERIAAANTRADGLQTQLEAQASTLNENAVKRAALIVQAQAVIGPTFDAMTISNRDLQTLVIKKLRPNDNTAVMSDAACSARYDALVETTVRGRESLAAAGATLIGGLETAAGIEQKKSTTEQERAAKMKAHREQWKQPLPSTQWK